MDIERVRRLDDKSLQIMAHVSQHPKLRPMEIANALDIESKYVYASLQRLVKAGVFDHEPSPESLISDSKTRLYFLANGVSVEGVDLIRNAGELKLAEVTSSTMTQPVYAVEELNGLSSIEAVRLLMRKQDGFNGLAAARINEIVLALRNTNSALDGALVQQQHFTSDIEELRSLVVQQGKALEQAFETIDYLLGAVTSAVTNPQEDPLTSEGAEEFYPEEIYLDEDELDAPEDAKLSPNAYVFPHQGLEVTGAIPEFNSDWPENLQLKWFDLMLALFDEKEQRVNEQA